MRLVILTLLVAVLLFGCASQQAPPPSNGGTGKTVEIKVSAKQFEFTPSTITVKKGDHVKITITSEDVTHGFAIPAFNVQTTESPGNPGVVEFDADKTGSFPFMCSNFCGSGHAGMKGTLIVTE
ncbi:MAG TPA: cupredoxin domain-containing protein [Candidatus Bilamarchaeum sp.]|nr:cupredoxin domain-containing protein [Candidatus Bilamarchaeum sp.]